MTTQPDISTMTTAQQARYAILCAQQSPQPEEWTRWAESWLSGEDRSETAALAVQGEVHLAARAAARAAEWAEAMAAAMAAAKGWAAQAAADAARLAQLAGKPLDLAALAKRAVEEEK